MAILEVSNLSKCFGKGHDAFVAVDNLSFSLEEGEVLGILGPNGAGKTTTIEMLLGTLTPTSGSILFFGQQVERLSSEQLAKIGHASAYHKLPGALTLDQNLDIIGRLWNIPKQERRERIDMLLTQFNLQPFRKAKASTLSAGQMTRLLLIKAFLGRPKILLLDEPTASLDPDIAEEVRHYILEQQRLDGVSIILTSHNMEEVAKMCSRAIVLQKGCIIEEDTPEQLARSVALNKLIIDVKEPAKAQALLDGLKYQVEGERLTIEIEEDKIPQLLRDFVHREIDFKHIEIVKPNLEDYFLHIARLS